MIVSRYKMKLPTISGVTGTTINIPIRLDYQMVDQSDIIERDFVNKETEKAINPIVDNEKARLTPWDGTNELTKITYNVIFKAGSTYADIGFVQDDIKFQRNNFKKSFLNLRFYDSDVTPSQNLLFSVSMYPRLDITHKATINTYAAVNTIPIRFNLSNPVNNPSGFAEGYYLYDYKDEIISGLPKEIYMDAEFNNAKDGKTTRLMTVPTPQPITNLIKVIYTRYLLSRDATGYFYKLDTSYSKNITPGTNSVTINLYERLTT